MVDLEKIKSEALKGKTLEEIFKGFGWKEFEDCVGEIFIQNEFRVKKNLRIKAKRWYEIDLVAARRNLVFCVDCKRWSGGRYKKFGIKKSVEEQEKRTRIVRSFLEKNPIFRENLNLLEKFEIRPLIVTLLEEDIIKEKNTFVVPIFKLNSFLLEFEKFL